MSARAGSLMTDPFVQDIQPWQNFYTLLGSSAAALLGLLFVSVSIHLDALKGEARALAYETFNQFSCLLLLSAICLVPTPPPPFFAVALLLLGMLAVGRQAVRRRARYRPGYSHPWRRDFWPALGYLILVGAGVAVWVTGAAPMGALLAASLMILIQATLNAWEMLLYLGMPASDAR
jgi:hypothetical protein